MKELFDQNGVCLEKRWTGQFNGKGNREPQKHMGLSQKIQCRDIKLESELMIIYKIQAKPIKHRLP